nr:tryptophan 2,3-dioxygenase family protein [uncultured Fluviicola sp.]
MDYQTILEKINEKYSDLGEKPETHLKGLLYSKPISYWDYIEVETLNSLQKPKTNFKDEEIFIMYHQVTELFFKMMIHELKQIVYEDLSQETVLEKLNRLAKYSEILVSSFDVMKYGMNYNDYNLFRSALTPASGFQSFQFRAIELYSTRIKNLLSDKNGIENPAINGELFEDLYWKKAGVKPGARGKSQTLLQFEEKYQEDLIRLAEKVQGKTLEEKLLSFPNPSEELVRAAKQFDFLYNFKWPNVHLETATHYLDSKGENQAATGGSEWKKYLNPVFQQRRFFPSFWKNDSMENWQDKL